MIVRIHSNGTSFKGTAAYLAHDPDKAKTSERVAWTHTLNCANDRVEPAVNEMLWTARDAELLKQEAGVRGGGRSTEQSVKHLSVNWAPGEQPTKEHIISTTTDLLRHMGWSGHQAIVFAHDDKSYKHVHVMLNMVHPETGLRLNDDFERRRAQAWAAEYEREHRIHCDQRLKNAADREKSMPRNIWVAFQENEKEFGRAENSLRQNEPIFMDEAKILRNSEWQILKGIQRTERTDFFSQGKWEFSQLRSSIYHDVRKEFRGRWADYYEARREGADPDTLVALKAELVADQKAVLEERRDKACSALREYRDGRYRALLDGQRETRAELSWRQEVGLDNAPFLNELSDTNARSDISGEFRDAAEQVTMRDGNGGSEAHATPEESDGQINEYRGDEDMGIRVGVSPGSLLDTLFLDLIGESANPRPRQTETERKFAAAAAEVQNRQQREDEEADTAWRRQRVIARE